MKRAGMDFDYNDYYCTSQLIGKYDGVIYPDLSAWTSQFSFDLNSLSVNPYFTSEDDLSMNHILLDGAANPIPDITIDIDGVPRDGTSPDIGAKEYDPCGLDAGITDIVNPTNPLGTGNQEVRVTLQNHGNNTLTTAQINWQINDELQNPFQWSGTKLRIIPGDSKMFKYSIGCFYFYTTFFQPGLYDPELNIDNFPQIIPG